VVNLKPRKMRFGVSEAMILAAEDLARRVVVCRLDDSIPPGTPIT
jgi:tRNA-binding EMAP/Myf-like protein